MRRTWLALAVLGATMLASPSAGASNREWDPYTFDTEQPPPPVSVRPRQIAPEPRRDLEPRAAPFGARGQLVIFGDSSVGASGNIYESDAKNFGVGVDLALAYFVATNLALGIDARASYEDARGYNAVSDFFRQTRGGAVAGPMVAYNVRLGRSVSIVPRLSFQIGAQSVKDEPITGNPTASPRSNTELDTDALAYLPLVVHPVQHFFIGIGPALSHHFGTTRNDIDVGTQDTTVGAWLVVGAYFGGDAPTDETPKGPPRRFQKRFGDAGTTMLTNDVDLEVFDTVHPRSGTSSQYFDTTFAIDHFAVDRVSIGAGVEVGYTHDEGTDALRQARYTVDSDLISLQGRVQYDLRLGESFALLPRARVSLVLDDYKSRIDASTNSSSSGAINVGLLVPLVAEVADHFILGFGPYMNQDLTRDNGSSQQNRRTGFGLESTLGGWW